ncbi:MAG: Gfo/Idh/MocA family oxidoreductase [Pseudomonadota bacterium]
MTLRTAGPAVKFAVLGVDHIHIYRMTEDMVAAGGVLTGWWTRGDPEPATGALRALPANLRRADYRTLLDDPAIDLVLVGAMPAERASLAVDALRSGKDVVSDKPGATTLDDLARVRQASAAAARFWSVNFSERYNIRAAAKATEIIGTGVIGEVIQTVGLGPHRGLLDSRQPWFFRRETGGGILCDLASHQIDNFIHFTGSRLPQLVTSAVGNFTRPEHPEFEDFGEVLLRSERASGYARVDWLTPDAQPYASDSRLTILGTHGTIEIRKYVDLGGRPGGDHLFVVHDAVCDRIDCTSVPLRHFEEIARDIRERSSTSEPQGHSFLVTELAIRAQQSAQRMGHLSSPACDR